MTKAKRIFISNRLPFSVNSKTKELKRGSGGLVSALLGIHLSQGFHWLGFETDIDVAQQLVAKSKSLEPQMSLHPVVLEKKMYEAFYDRFSNDVLWPLFHYESHHVQFRRDDWQSYIDANKIMAEEVLKVASSGDTVWIHDFHFLLLPEMLKAQRPDLKVGFFLHTPFPSSEIFRQLPVREEILCGVIRADLIGFHEHSYLRHFTVSLKAHLGIDSSVFKAEIGEHTLNLGVYPISIDTDGLRHRSSSLKVKELTENYKDKIPTEFLILGVDRLDYSKGLELKLRGFKRLLQKYPETRGKISLLQVAVPTRAKVPAYIRLKREVDQLVGTINGEYGQPGYIPVHYIYNSISETDLLALYRRSECLLVTSKRDGMNLVAIEYVVAKDPVHPGVLVLSEFAGAASLLGESIFINPWDEDSVADTLYNCFKMPVAERHSRLQALQEILSKYSATQWANSFLVDLDKMNLKFDSTHTRRLKPGGPYKEIESQMKLAPQYRLVLDYDGTLVSLQKRPQLAILSKELKDNLIELNERVPIYILSGRARSFLDEQFSDCPFPLAAEHGAFYKEPGGEWRSRVSSDIGSWYSEVQRVMESYTDKVPMSFVEQKEASLVWHYRLSPSDFSSYQARKLDDELQVGLANLPVVISAGSKMIEAKAVECDKGNFLRWLMEQDKSGSLFICIGDDRTDESMFRVLGDQGISIKVGTENTAARYRVAKQDEVMPLLKSIPHFL